MGGLVVAEQTERPALITVAQPVETHVCNEVRHIAIIDPAARRVDHFWIVVQPLTRQDTPKVEPRRLVGRALA